MNLLTVKDVINRTPFSKSYIYDLITKGELPAHRVGKGKGRIVVLEDEFDAWLRNLPPASERGEVYGLSTTIVKIGGALATREMESGDPRVRQGRKSRAL